MNGLDLFSGIGGITLALQEYVRPLIYCEIDKYCQSLLLQRMQEGNLPKAPIWDDIRTLLPKEFKGIDIIYGGFPCQDISIAGRQKGLEGERSGLFFEILRIIDATKAPFIFLENVPNIRTKGAERVCKELAERGYDSRWCMLSARDVGARHKRERWFLLGYSNNNGSSPAQIKEGNGKAFCNSQKGKDETTNVERTDDTRVVADTSSERLQGQSESKRTQQKYPYISDSCGWTVEPNVGRMVNGLSNRVDRIKALGNSVVPLQVIEAFKILMGLDGTNKA